MQTTKSLYELFETITDIRSVHGRRYKLADLLALCTLAILNGCDGYRGISRYFQNHKTVLCQALGLEVVPSYDTVKNFLNSVDMLAVQKIFITWMQQYVESGSGDWYAIDGKAMAGTIVDSQGKQQNFVSLVRLVQHNSGLIVGSHSYENGKSGETEAARQLLNNCAAQMEGNVLTADSLHCNSKTLAKIMDLNVDYVVQLKGNCAALKKKALEVTTQGLPDDTYIFPTEKAHGREENCEVALYRNVSDLPPRWSKFVKGFIVLTCWGINNKKKPYAFKRYFVTNRITASAKELGKGIKGHWSVETVHYIKDVIMLEDQKIVHEKNAAVVLSILGDIAINLYKMNGHKSIKAARECYQNRVEEQLELMKLGHLLKN